MSRLRNPFKLRASEKIESDASFLRLYSPIALDSLIDKHDKNALWNNVLYINSSPGSGKSSLLRVFEPTTLVTLLNNRTASDYKGIFSTLKKLGVISDEGVNVLGVTLTCTRNYEILEELDVSEGMKKRYFFALLNSRIILATLRAITNLISTNLNFLEALQKINFSYDNRDNYFTSLSSPCNGEALYNWASEIEKRVYEAIDSFMPLSQIKPKGSDELFALEILNPTYISVEGVTMPNTFLFMLDDSHKLSPKQRLSLKKYVIEKRGKFSIWISQRLEALLPSENLGSFEGRDYEELNLEKFWSDQQEKFGKILISIADKRAAISTDDVNSFKEYLTNELEEETYRADFIKSEQSTKQSISNYTDYTNKFDNWLAYLNDYSGTPSDRAILFKQVEILTARNTGKVQLSLDFPYTKEELLEKVKPSDIHVVAKLFVHKSSKIPYYFGQTDLIKLSSNNIEQFLSFSADLFEEMLSNRLSGNSPNISTKDQERIIMKVAVKKWNELHKILPFSNTIIQFLTELSAACKKETYKINAPYPPGVTGFAIKIGRNLFSSNQAWFNEDPYKKLSEVLSICVSFNLLEKKEIIQGAKNKKNDVFYLNRWLCAYFDLPLGYGGWRHRDINELAKWAK